MQKSLCLESRSVQFLHFSHLAHLLWPICASWFRPPCLLKARVLRTRCELIGCYLCCRDLLWRQGWEAKDGTCSGEKAHSRAGTGSCITLNYSQASGSHRWRGFCRQAFWMMQMKWCWLAAMLNARVKCLSGSIQDEDSDNSSMKTLVLLLLEHTR